MPPLNLAIAQAPVYEAIPVHMLVALAGITFYAFAYTLVAYAIIRLVRQRRSLTAQ